MKLLGTVLIAFFVLILATVIFPDSGKVIASILLFSAVAFVYFIPTINAKNRKHLNTEGIFILNFFFGWTLIGWVIALIWSTTQKVVSPAQSPSA